MNSSRSVKKEQTRSRFARISPGESRPSRDITIRLAETDAIAYILEPFRDTGSGYRMEPQAGATVMRLWIGMTLAAIGLAVGVWWLTQPADNAPPPEREAASSVGPNWIQKEPTYIPPSVPYRLPR